MTKRVTIACVVAIAMLQAAAPAWATIGSVISSFGLDRYSTYGIYREGNYIYIPYYRYSPNYLETYTLSGSQTGRIELLSFNPLKSGSANHLGAGYVAFCSPYDGYLKIFSITQGGYPVASFSTMTDARNNFWDGDYYYVNRWTEKGVFRRYTRTGANAGTWTCAGWPAAMNYCSGAEYAARGNYGAGPYFVASSGETGPCCITTFPGGSLVSTWKVPRGGVRHLAYGGSSLPATYGAAIWAILYDPYYVLEFDIHARGASAVLPASVGKIKAIYR